MPTLTHKIRFWPTLSRFSFSIFSRAAWIVPKEPLSHTQSQAALTHSQRSMPLILRKNAQCAPTENKTHAQQQQAVDVLPAAKPRAPRARAPPATPTKTNPKRSTNMQRAPAGAHTAATESAVSVKVIKRVAHRVQTELEQRLETLRQCSVSLNAMIREREHSADLAKGHPVSADNSDRARLLNCSWWERPLRTFYLGPIKASELRFTGATGSRVSSQNNSDASVVKLQDFYIHQAFPGYCSNGMTPVVNATSEVAMRECLLRLGVPPLIYPGAISFSARPSELASE